MARPLKIAKAHAVITITATTASTNLVTTSADFSASTDVSSNGSTLGIIKGMPFVVASNVGGLVANTTYWILNVVSQSSGGSTFTVSATPLNANPTSTPVTLTTTTGQTVLATVAPVSTSFNNPNGSANTYGVVGGNTAIIGNQVVGSALLGIAVPDVTVTVVEGEVTLTGDADFEELDGDEIYTTDGRLIGEVSFTAGVDEEPDVVELTLAAPFSYTGGIQTASEENAYILRQKGKQKFLVKGLTTGTVAAAYTVDSTLSPQPLNSIVITSTTAGSVTGSVQALSNKNIELFTEDSGPIATGNIVLSEASPAIATFNTAAVANVSAGIPHPIVDISSQ